MGKSSKRAAEEPTTTDATMVDAAPAKRSKKDKKSGDDEEVVDVSLLAEIAKPLAVAKVNKRVLKLVKKASKSRHLKRGVKEVVKSVRKGEKGIIILAADISPLDILTHIPLLAEEANCPYIWVASKESLGLASSTKRPTSCVMVAEKGAKRKAKEGEAPKDESKAKEVEKEFTEAYEEVKKEVEALENAVPTY